MMNPFQDYVIAPDSNPVDKKGVWFLKVGRSKNVPERIAEYVVYFPYDSHFCGVMPVRKM